jgi:hypothetical protein
MAVKMDDEETKKTHSLNLSTQELRINNTFKALIFANHDSKHQVLPICYD